VRHTLVLASASPARLALLRAAGFAPRVVVSGVDEDGMEAAGAAELACALAEAKADAVAQRLATDPPALIAAGDGRATEPCLRAAPAAAPHGAAGDGVPSAGTPRDAGEIRGERGAGAGAGGHGSEPGRVLVVGCDTVLDFGGEVRGKPRTSAQACDWWRAYRGREGTLVTGHAVIDVATGRRAVAPAQALIRFGSPTDAEIDAYVATGEPLVVAGAFTLDGYCAPFVTSIDGDPGTVLGLSPPLLRTLLADLGVAVTDLWAATSPAGASAFRARPSPERPEAT
jgi:nucleoside triphosphate pyrophosphatase